MRNSRTPPYYGTMSASSLASNAGMQVHASALRWRPERRLTLFRSRVTMSASSLASNAGMQVHASALRWRPERRLTLFRSRVTMSASSLASNAGMQVHASALRWRPERRLTLFRSRVVFLSFSSLPCFCTFYSSIPTRNEVFFRNFFPLVSVLFWGVSKPTFKIQLVSPPNSISHCRRRVDR